MVIYDTNLKIYFNEKSIKAKFINILSKEKYGINKSNIG